MKLSTKGRYAMVALADLALVQEAGHGDDLLSLAEVSKRQDISLPYLEQLVRQAASRRVGRGGAGAGGRLPSGPQRRCDPYFRGDGGG